MADADGVAEVDAPAWNDAPDRDARRRSRWTRDDDDAAPLRGRDRRGRRRDHPDLRSGRPATSAIDDGINDQVADDLSSAEGISLPVTLSSCCWPSAR